MDAIKILGMKLINGGKKLSVSFEDTGDCPADDDKIGKNACHPDLIFAVQQLAVHLIILGLNVPEKGAHKSPYLEAVTVTGYSIGGKEGSEGYTLKGYLVTRRGGTVAINSPFTRIEEGDETRYTLMDDLQKKIVAIEKEVIQYLKEGKKAEEEAKDAPKDDPNQQKFEFPEDPKLKAELGKDDRVVRMHVTAPKDGAVIPGQAIPIPPAAAVGGRGRGGGGRKPQTPDNPAGE